MPIVFLILKAVEFGPSFRRCNQNETGKRNLNIFGI